LSELQHHSGAAPGDTLCPAPLVNLHFSQLGVVTACCFNRTQVLGVYPKNSIREIWEGSAAAELRQALAKADLSKGCDKCLQQILARDFGGSHVVFFSNYSRVLAARREELGMIPRADSSIAPTPLRLEFNVHNSCNLQCVMCHGLASSAIRSQREDLNPLPNPYDDSFVDQLEPFLPYVVETEFIGGEPFLIPLYLKIWKRMSGVNPKTRISILTNATTLEDGIRELLESINCWIHVSIDSHRKGTYESIRRGASYDRVMANCSYFQDLMARRGLPFYWRYCPMRLNWHEIPDTVEYCAERGIGISFNQLDSPLGLSLTTLPTDELSQVVDALAAREPKLPPTYIGFQNLQNYRDLVARLRGFLEASNRAVSLRCRLDQANAVVSRYSRGREDELRQRESGSLEDRLTQAVKNYLITRLNVESAYGKDAEIPAEFAGDLKSAEHILNGMRDETGSSRFLTTYLKELIRTYSGVWGVSHTHDRAVFGLIDELNAGIEEQGSPGGDGLWDRVVRMPLGKVYEGVGFAASASGMRRWLEELPE